MKGILSFHHKYAEISTHSPVEHPTT